MKTLQRLKEFTNTVAAAIADAQASIAEMRGKITQLQQRVAFERDSPVPIDELKARIPSIVQELGAAWHIHRRVPIVASIGSAIDRPRMPQMFEPFAGMSFAMICALTPTTAIEMLEAWVNLEPYQAGAPMATRAALLEQLEQELAEAEQMEERTIDEAIAAGVVIEHRPEVVERRTQEARTTQLQEFHEEDIKRRQAELNTRYPRRKVGVSEYLTTNNPEYARRNAGGRVP